MNLFQKTRRQILTEGFFQNRNTTFEGHLTYNRNFGLHNFSGLLLYTQSAFYDDNFNAGRSLYNSSAIDQLFAGPVLNATNDGSASESGREGYVGRLTYGFDGKYLIEANFGYNGSENFPLRSRFGFFPSASVGWVLSKEDFLAKSTIVDFLKVRASYGEVGNDKIGRVHDGSYTSNLSFMAMDMYSAEIHRCLFNPFSPADLLILM